MALGLGGIAIGTGTSLGIEELRQKAADPNDDSPAAAASRAVCDVHSATGIGYTQGIGTGIALDGFCRPYYDQSGFDPPTQEVPFEGGQCEGDRYRVSFFSETTTAGRNEFTDTGAIYRGPITNATGPNDSETTADVGWNYRTAGGQVAYRRIIQTSRDAFVDAGVTSVVNLDGPDDCGNPPAEVEPGPNNPGRQPGSTSPTTVYGDTVDVTIDTDVDVFGNPVFVTSFNVGGVEISPQLVFSPTVEVGLPARPAPAPTEGDPVNPVEPSGEVEDDISPEEAAEGLETIGYRWTLTGLPGNIAAVVGKNPRALITPYGNIQLKHETDTGADFWSDNLPIKAESGSIIRSEASLKVRAVSYNIRPDVGGITLIPIRAKGVKQNG